MEHTPETAKHVSGFVSLVGRPNAGKSTLLNALVGAKLAIVADKPQTTRTIVQGVVTEPGAQIVFLDSPGIHVPKTMLHKRMMEHVKQALDGRDLILYVADALKPPTAEDDQALQWIKPLSTPVFLILNKVDALKDKSALLALIEAYRARHEFAEYIPVSARTGDGLDVLKKAIVARLPEGPAYFPEDHLTDQPERFLAAEFVREKILQLTRQEVPHSVAVVVDTWEDTVRADGTAMTRILATIHVERHGHKSIVIGERGSMLKQIGSEARKDIEALLGRKVYLELFVRVNENWRQKAQFIDELEPHGLR